MMMRRRLLGCALMLSIAAAAEEGQDFSIAYQAYRDALAAGQYHVALEHAARARDLGASLYPDDLRKTAMLVFNHGFVLRAN